ncbi:protein kinase [Streptomyces sp. NPDC087440]|uniref:serine/threonine-protein kinase n=1 Tax=Streptomyces sp. NPDC087440 TaxID=3365790 RepID=UPI0037F376E5
MLLSWSQQALRRGTGMPGYTSGGMQGLLIAGRYRLGQTIGQGGMGRVWRADDEILDRAVAVKEMRMDGLDAEDTRIRRERTLREARATARIDHPNVVRVYDVADEGERLWIVMELVDSRSLEQLLVEDGPVSPREAARIGLGVTAALREVHARGVLHRDIKPGNVLLGRGNDRVVLTDFGIAAIQNTTALTIVGMLVGSPDYMAPERVGGRPQGAPSDLWSLGATLCAAVAGTSPFTRPTTMATLHAVLYEEPELPAEAGELAPILAALLAKEPEARPTVEALHDALTAVLLPPRTPTLVERGPVLPVVEPRQEEPAPPAEEPAASVAEAPEPATPEPDASARTADPSSAPTVPTPTPPSHEPTRVDPNPSLPPPVPVREPKPPEESPAPEPEGETPVPVPEAETPAPEQGTLAPVPEQTPAQEREPKPAPAPEHVSAPDPEPDSDPDPDPDPDPAPEQAPPPDAPRRRSETADLRAPRQAPPPDTGGPGKGRGVRLRRPGLRGRTATPAGTVAAGHPPVPVDAVPAAPAPAAPDVPAAATTPLAEDSMPPVDAPERPATEPPPLASTPAEETPTPSPDASAPPREPTQVVPDTTTEEPPATPAPEPTQAAPAPTPTPDPTQHTQTRTPTPTPAPEPTAEEPVVLTPTATPAPRPPRRARSLLAAGLGVVVALGIAVTLVLTQGGGSPADKAAAPSTGTSQKPTVAGTARPPTGADRPGARNETGFSWVPPSGWTRSAKNPANVHYHSPDGTQEIAAAYTLAQGEDLLTQWQKFEEESHDVQDYQKIRLERTTFQGRPAVIWEYTYAEGGTPRQGRQIGFNAGGKSYQINVWFEKPARVEAFKNYERVADSFEPL